MSTPENAAIPPIDEPQTSPEKAVWNPITRIAFRFAFAYFGMYAFPLFAGYIPGIAWFADLWIRMWHVMVPWVGAHVLHLSQPITYFVTGSGDTTADWVLTLCQFTIAMGATVIWSVLDRRRTSYVKLHEWLRLGLRFALGAVLIWYGTQKVIPVQFRPPDYFRLLERYGDSSPMGLLWTSIGFSPAYTIFTGLVELVGGVLVIIPWLTTLGALVCAAAMTNVFLLNMCYDVPVKLLSFHLLLMALFLLLPDFPRLARVVLNRETPPRTPVPLFSRRALNIALLALQLCFCVYATGISLYSNYNNYRTYVVTKPPFHGIWMVDEFSVDGQPRPPLLTDPLRWQRLIFALPTIFSVQRMDGTIQHYRVNIDMDKKIFALTKSADPAWKANLNFSTPQSAVMVLDGLLEGHSIHVTTRLSDDKFVLTSRGFHWVTERSFVK
jgi:uncharacterized membrane protein YphA (DoxX/SURF4 family)